MKNLFETYLAKINAAESMDELKKINEAFRNDAGLTDDQKDLLECESYGVYDYFSAVEYSESAAPENMVFGARR